MAALTPRPDRKPCVSLCSRSPPARAGRTDEASPGHARHSSHHPSANHVTGSCTGLRHDSQARPPVPPNRVHLCSGLVFGLDPSPRPLTRGGCRLLMEVLFLYRSSMRDLNPLVTCAAGRTSRRLPTPSASSATAARSNSRGPLFDEGQGEVSLPPAFPNRTCGFPAYGSPPVRLFRAVTDCGRSRWRRCSSARLTSPSSARRAFGS